MKKAAGARGSGPEARKFTVAIAKDLTDQATRHALATRIQELGAQLEHVTLNYIEDPAPAQVGLTEIRLFPFASGGTRIRGMFYDGKNPSEAEDFKCWDGCADRSRLLDELLSKTLFHPQRGLYKPLIIRSCKRNQERVQLELEKGAEVWIESGLVYLLYEAVGSAFESTPEYLQYDDLNQSEGRVIANFTQPRAVLAEKLACFCRQDPGCAGLRLALVGVPREPMSSVSAQHDNPRSLSELR